jgi:hypothetical protein
MDAALGVLLVLGVVVVGFGLVAGVHVLVRPKGTGDLRVSDALRNLEPRGGRHRFSLRHFELVLLAILWWTALGLFLLLAPLGSQPGERALAVLLIGGGVVAMVTWWIWRRGAMRPPQPRHVTEGPASRVTR